MRLRLLHHLITATLLIGLAPAGSIAQKNQHIVSLRFVPVFSSQPLWMERAAYGRDSIRISMLRFYISGIKLYRGGQPAWAEPQSVHLIDATEPERMGITLEVPAGMAFDRLGFSLGIDSATNAAGAGGGELDATKGMYWAWQSGYINLKLEGTSPLCKTRKNMFQFHLGGFRGSNYCMQPVMLPASGNNSIDIAVDVAAFLSYIDLSTQNTVMIPGAEAVALSKKAALMFSIRTP